jgi:hypothetical protein
MNSNLLRALQGLMWFVCVFHVAVGVGLNFAGSGFIDTMADLYGAEHKDWSPQFLYILRPLGAFMLALGIAAAAAALDPRRYRAVIWAFVVLFGIRATHRILFADDVETIFGIANSRSMVQMVFFYVLAAALLILERLIDRQPARQTATT